MKSFYSITVALVLVALSACASGDGKKAPDLVFGHWQAMTGKVNGEKLCYIGTAPVQTVSSIPKRAQPYMMLTLRKAGAFELSVSSGYPYLASGRVLLVTDGQEHTLLFQGATAWAHNGKEDGELIKALKNAGKVEVLGVSQQKQTSKDEYSLGGMADALAYIRGHCK